ncbi:tyrosine-protein phosphatase [Aquibacillus sediminis]|uniref:tyrosine-protein phosphatase n=1 Tax=Aquibacillus sediminis TaxID=2574734 RepID=UPI00110835F4|nr:CpsB/CapC family capsule biosynthesis tyrosine phosphatase [Aquibacillus sediminis]
MIDIHCHILPQVDDGAKTIEDSIAMAKEASIQGIDTIIATPHHLNGAYENVTLDIMENVRILNERLLEQEIAVTILPGQETRINGEMIDDLERGDVLPLNVTSGYLFVELPSNHVPRYTKQLLFDLQMYGVKPVIVHPERNKEIMEHPNILYEFVKNGTLTQVTAASVIGKFGKKIHKFTHQLVEANLTHFVASDAHNTTTRGFCMLEASEEIKSVFGMVKANEFIENAQYLIDGATVIGDVPQPIKKKKFLGII